jgi:hypothetical protein
MKRHGAKPPRGQHAATGEVKSSRVVVCPSGELRPGVCADSVEPDQESSAHFEAPDCTGQNCPFRQKYFDLLEIMKETGLLAYDMLNENQRLRLIVVQYLKKEYGEIKVTPLSLHTLKPEVRNAGMAFLYTHLGGDPRAKDIVHEVFRSPRNRRRRDCTDAYR